jgi:two-component system, sensor histidine kinase ChiS
LKKLPHILILLLCTSLTAQNERLTRLSDKMKRTYKSGQGDSALFYSRQLFAEAEKAGSAKYQVRAEFYKAKVLAEGHRLKEAFDAYFLALRKSRESGETEQEGHILEDIAQLYFEQRNYPEARRFFQEQISHRLRAGDSVKLANTLLNISMLYRRSEGYDSAAVLLERVRKIAFAKKDSMLLAHYFDSHAGYFFSVFVEGNKINDYGNDPDLWNRNFKFTNLRDSAEIYWQKAFSIWRAEKHIQHAIQPLFNLGYLYHTKKDRARALKHYLAASQIADSLHLDAKRISLYGNLAELYYDMASYRQSADFFRKYLELKDSVQKSELKAYSVQLEKQYQLENKSQTILKQELELSRKNEKINQQRKQIYFYLLIFIVLLFALAAIVFYINFNKRVNRKIDEAKEKFFTNIMHEIRTPLSMIQAPLKTLKPKLNDEESRYYIQLAEKNVFRLNELINQMLDVSRMQNSSYRLNESVGTLALFFSDIIHSFEKLATEKNISFVSEISGGDALLIYDKDALEKILSNLLSNAIKYTPNNGTVGLTVNREDGDEASRLLMDVWDTGIGIPKQEQAKVFDRFFRSGKSANKTSGVGIGLSLVKDLVTAHKGNIVFTSEENKGSRFTVELILKHPEKPGTVPPQLSEGNKPVILLIEDDMDILDFTGNFLRSKNLETVKAKNGKEAKTLLKNITPDLIVTDLMMDELDGLSFIKEIRSNKGLNHIPVIVLSAKSAGQTRVEVLSAGAQAFLSKPFLPEELFSVISNQLELISKIRKELKGRIEAPEADLAPEKKFSSSEPYTQKLFDLIFKNLDNSELSVEILADLMATNRSHFQRKIKSLTGYSPSELVKFIRLEKSKEFLLAKKGNITEVAYMCGFSSQSYFTKCFTQHFGYSPTQANAQQPGQ